MGPPSPAFADEHWSSEGCNPFVISRLNLGKLLSCARVQHETQLKRHSNLSKPPVTHRTAAQGFLLAVSHNRSIADCDISSAIKGPAQQYQECAQDERGH